jgi:putative ubiquitin-RnfH superfamily antitoxin RatB of RatAB toxin-antitoxin module
VADALAASGLAELAGQSSTIKNIGIWGTPALPDTELRDQDRVEIYRDLVADPKQARRQRAKLQHGTKPRS